MVTFFLVPPTFLVVWQFSHNLLIALVASMTMLFAGLLFGPDLDTHSVQYSRWGIFRVIWFPYQKFFSHRSRWSHGLLFGTFLRIVYFLGIVSVFAIGVIFIGVWYGGGEMPNLSKILGTWHQIGDYTREKFGENFFLWVFGGFWWGAASHTITDIIGTFIKTGKVKEFL